jgi:uncharacterized protein (TIGR02145 family)/uncharacterized repeat protein (TIGR02543 family)
MAATLPISLFKKRKRMKKAITITLAVVITLAFVSCNDNGIGNSKGGPADRFVESFVNYTLTVNRNPTAGGTVSPSGSSTRSGGSSVTVTATAASGYTFTGWSGTLTSTNPSVSIIMNGNRTLTANFTQNAPTTYTLTVNRNPTAGGTVSPSGSSTHNAGSSVTVSATAASGYTFTGWSGASTSTSSSVSITMNGDRTLTANFTQSTPTTGSFTDSRDGRVYRTVTIGTQTWMAQNLNWAGDNGNLGMCYANSPDSCAKYGRLYTWNTVMAGSPSSSSSPSGVRGVCPVGWHVPSDAEWTTLINFVGSNAGTKLKSRSGWNSGGNGTDDFGFSALPGGGRSGGFHSGGDNGYWWSATEDDATYAQLRGMHWVNSSVFTYRNGKSDAFSLRCAQDVRP